MDENTVDMFGEAMRLKLDANEKHLKELAKDDPAIAEMLRMDSAPGKADVAMKDLPAEAAKKATE